MNLKTTILLFGILLIGCSKYNQFDSELPSNTTIAFIGDQGLGENAKSVLRLIKEENADAVLHMGDFDYEGSPEKWDSQINEILGDGFPYLAVVGNHDVGAWKEYQEKIKQRIQRTGINCIGDIGVKSACYFKGIFIVLSGAGTKDFFHEDYIKDQLAETNSVWRICSWHKNQRLMQAGGKKDEVGWEPYDECRKQGAIIATAHEHSYSRTYLMDGFENQSIASNSSILNIEEGKTFAFVSGLGGRSIREQNDELASKKWWASVYTATQNATYGALFCNFVKTKAHCYFKDIDGKIQDEFYIENNVKLKKST